MTSTIVMFRAQNRETINSTWKVVAFFKIIMTTSVTDRVSQHNIRPACARPRPIVLVSDRSCSKTDGLWPHHCYTLHSMSQEVWSTGHDVECAECPFKTIKTGIWALYVVDHERVYSVTGYLYLFGHVARLEYQHVHTPDGGPMKTESQWPPGEDRRSGTALWLDNIQEDADAIQLSTLWRSEIASGHAERRNGHATMLTKC